MPPDLMLDFKCAINERGRTTLLVVRPHSEHLDDAFAFKNLVHEAMLDVDPARKSSGQIANQFLEWWRGAIRILTEHVEEPFHVATEP